MIEGLSMKIINSILWCIAVILKVWVIALILGLSMALLLIILIILFGD